MATPCLEFPRSLWEKYAPETLDQFIGLDRAKAVFGSFVRKPFASAWLLLGPSGTGKTTMGLAVAKALSAELHHVPQPVVRPGDGREPGAPVPVRTAERRVSPYPSGRG
jgi:Holliday junction resolvasome RuvABC ATP-dependent DNA helicase subunit